MDGTRQTIKPDGKEHRKMVDGYNHFLAMHQKQGSPREAHLFALELAHKGMTFGKTVGEIIMELEGSLPTYWEGES